MPSNNLRSLIVVVDDSANDVILLQSRLDAAGIKNPVAVFDDGARAIEFLSATFLSHNGSKPPPLCLLLLDLHMPRLGGLNILRWARSRPEFERVTIALLSGSDGPTDFETAYAAGADRYLVKHPVADVLVEIVQSAEERAVG